jgi:hypothetical protein
MSQTLPRAKPGKVYVVRLPNGLACPIPSYVAGWRALKAMDERAKVRGWDHFPAEAGAILRALREGMHDRINRALPWSQDSRKWSPLWQRDMARAARDLNHPRLVISWLPPELRERFGHRLRDPADY